jgi:hypothetical protein
VRLIAAKTTASFLAQTIELATDYGTAAKPVFLFSLITIEAAGAISKHGPGNAGGLFQTATRRNRTAQHCGRSQKGRRPQKEGVTHMRTLLIPAAAAAILASSAFAFAAAQHTTGTVKAFDAKAMTLSLADGSQYSLPQSFKDPGIKAGEKVNVSWEQSGAKKMADSVTIVK